MNWGYKILTVYIIFVAGILLLVFKSSTEKTDLVTADYYAQELKYQQKIDESRRTHELSAEPAVEIKGDQLLVHFPKDFARQKLEGDAVLYYPADENRDVKKNFSVQDTDLVMIIPSVNKGLHELHLSWQVNGVKYYFEKKLFI